MLVCLHVRYKLAFLLSSIPLQTFLFTVLFSLLHHLCCFEPFRFFLLFYHFHIIFITSIALFISLYHTMIDKHGPRSKLTDYIYPNRTFTQFAPHQIFITSS